MSEYIYATDEHEGHWLTGEEIVRCRDCKHYHDDPYPHCDNYFTSPQSDGFCAWGERKAVS